MKFNIKERIAELARVLYQLLELRYQSTAVIQEFSSISEEEDPK